MFQSPQLVLCHKTERVTIFKIPPLSTTKGYYLDDWKEMIWQGGVKVTEKDKEITITFIDKSDKIFAQTKIKSDQVYTDCIVKTMDSSRGYAVRLQKPNGGYLWIGVAFRDRNDAFDFGVVFQDNAQRKKMDKDPQALQKQFEQKMDFGLKKGQKIKINFNNKQKNSTHQHFSDFNFDNDQKVSKKKQKKVDQDWFGDFGAETKKTQKKSKKGGEGDYNLLDL